MSKVTLVEHPLVQHKLSYLRDKETPTVHFRKLVNELTLLLTYEATKDFPTAAGCRSVCFGAGGPTSGSKCISSSTRLCRSPAGTARIWA